MNIFKEVKERVTAKEAAERYGLKVGRGNMACCPFHDDKHPSMKIDRNYYCFACGKKGDAINYTSELFGISGFKAAKKLNEDFSLGLQTEQSEKRKNQKAEPKINRNKPAKEERLLFVRKKIDAWKKESADILLRYLQWMEFWKEFYKPEAIDDEWHPLFTEALRNESRIGYLLDILLSGTDEEIRVP